MNSDSVDFMKETATLSFVLACFSGRRRRNYKEKTYSHSVHWYKGQTNIQNPPAVATDADMPIPIETIFNTKGTQCLLNMVHKYSRKI